MVQAAFPLLLTTPSFNAPFNAIAWQTIPATGVEWGRKENTALTSAFLFFQFLWWPYFSHLWPSPADLEVSVAHGLVVDFVDDNGSAEAH